MTPIRTLVMERVVEILGRIAREHADEGFTHDVTPERVRRGRRIMPNDPPPCISVFVGLEQPEQPGPGTSARPRRPGAVWCELPVTVAFKDTLDQDADGLDLDTAAERFIADVQLAFGIAARTLGASAFYVSAPKWPTGDVVPDHTVWWEEVGVGAFTSEAAPNAIFGQVDFLFHYPRSIFHPCMV